MSPKPEPRANRQWQGRPNAVLAVGLTPGAGNAWQVVGARSWRGKATGVRRANRQPSAARAVPAVMGLTIAAGNPEVILPPAPGVSNEGRSSPLLVLLPAVSWPWAPAWGSLEPPRRDGENAQKPGKSGEQMGEIRSKTCEGAGITSGAAHSRAGSGSQLLQSIRQSPPGAGPGRRTGCRRS